MVELFAKINGINICYEIHGMGVPLILIHGYANRKERWFCQVHSLKKTLKIITLDLRSSGKSDHPNEPITMEIFADDINGLMNFLNIKKASLGGISMGGMIAQQFALKYPENLDKLILINTAYSSKWLADTIMQEQIRALELKKQDYEKFFWEQATFLYHQKIRKEMQKDPKKKFYNLWSAEDLIKMDSENPMTVEDLKNHAHAMSEFDVFEKLNEIKNPTLLICASHDRILPNSQMFQMNEKIPNSTLKIVQNAGHGSEVSQAPEINKLIIDFLKN
jgi:proline-specific peptidase